MAPARGTVYLPVLSAAMVVTLMALSAMYVLRVQRRSAQADMDASEAGLYARSAVEMGMLWIMSDPNWRINRPNGSWATDQPVGQGKYSLEVADPGDGDLANSPEDSVVLTGIGVKGACRHKMQVTLVADNVPLEALRTCIHAAGELEVKSGKVLTVMNGPVSSNGNLRIDGTVDGSAEGATRSGGGTITGTVTVPALAKTMPDPGIFQAYRDLAVTIPFPGGTIQKVVLSPGSNPWGVTSPDGVYFIDTGGSDLTLKGVRLWGTLVVRATGKKVILDDAVFMHPYRSDYPVLIVDGSVEITIRSGEYPLLEIAWATNFNPAGSPREGQTDSDTGDSYPNEVQGLIHLTGSLLMRQSACVRGAIISEAGAVFDEFPAIYHSAALYTDPPMGYRTTVMKTAPRGWKQAVD